MASLLETLTAGPQRLYARLAAGFWTARGRRALARGEVARGVKALEQAVSWRPEGFKPLLLLAGGYLRAQETWCAHRALARARETDPARFARLAPTLLARSGVDPEMLGRVLKASLPRARSGAKVPTLSVATRPDVRARPVEPNAHPYGDCADLDEYARFRAMPPISADEIEGLDWDRLLGDLLDD